MLSYCGGEATKKLLFFCGHGVSSDLMSNIQQDIGWVSSNERDRASFGDKKDVLGREYASTSEKKSGKTFVVCQVALCCDP